MGARILKPACPASCKNHGWRAPVAQLDRVADFESVGREFESLRAHHFSPNPMTIAAASELPESVALHGAPSAGTGQFGDQPSAAPLSHFGGKSGWRP